MRIKAPGERARWGAAAFGVSLILLSFAPSVSLAANGSTGSDDVAPDKSARRVEALRRGVNLSHWFAQVMDRKGYVADHFQTSITVKDLELIRSLGFDHVRLSTAPEPMFVRGQADRLPANYLQYLDDAIKMILSQALAVVIDIHPDAEFKRGLQASNQHVEAFADFWRALAAHLSSTDPERVFLEVLNEPEFDDPYRWSGVQTLLVSAIRQGAPDHTIIVSGHRWASLEDLLALEPLRDRNLIYNFHFYSPALFTHQGATWGVNFWHYLKEVPYPSAPENIEKVLAAVPHDQQRLHLVRYGQERWNLARIEAEIAEIARWAQKHGIQVTCNEFGVHKKVVDPGARAAWIHDVRRTLERHKIGWTVWDYSGDFAVVSRESGKISPDDTLLRALGFEQTPGSAGR